MNKENNLENKLQELGKAIGSDDSLVDGVMQRISKIPHSQNLNRSCAYGKFGILTAAAVFMIISGFTIGRLTVPEPLNNQQQNQLVSDLRQLWLSDLAESDAQLKNEIEQQYREDMSQFAMHTLTASNTMTNQLLTELIKSINQAQEQNRQWVVNALNQVEENRLQDKNILSDGLKTLAIETNDELMQTRQDIAQILVRVGSEKNLPNELDQNF